MNKKTKRTIILGASLSPFVIGISTIMAIKGLTMAPALYFDMRERAQEWVSYAEYRQADPAAAQSVADTLAPVHHSICTAADMEGSQGLITGSPGKGAVSAALVSSCTGLDAIAETLQQTVERNTRRTESLTAALEALRKIPEQEDLSIFERQNKFRGLASEIRADLAEGSAENLREKVSAQISVLSNSIVQLEPQNGQFGERQTSAVASLKLQLVEVDRIVKGFLELSTSSEDMAEPADLLSSGAAIKRWWPRMVPQILLAIAVDLSILWMATFLTLSRASLRETETALRRKAGNSRARTNRSNNLKPKKV